MGYPPTFQQRLQARLGHKELPTAQPSQADFADLLHVFTVRHYTPAARDAFLQACFNKSTVPALTLAELTVAFGLLYLADNPAAFQARLASEHANGRILALPPQPQLR